MKTTSTMRMAGALAAISLCWLPAATAGPADQGSKSNARESANNNNSLQLHRADSLFGLDVVAQDGRKVGDIVDFAFRFDGEPRVTHALVMTGGILDMGGDVRAVPIDAIKLTEDSARLNASEQDFRRAPILPGDRAGFFADPVRLNQVAENFGQKKDNSSAGDRQRSGSAEDPASRYVLFSGLNRNEAWGAENTNLGTVTDAWIDLAGGTVPLVEIRPSPRIGSPFTVNEYVRYELPAAKYQRQDNNRYYFDVTSREVADAPTAASLDRATLAYDQHGQVLRLDVRQPLEQASNP